MRIKGGEASFEMQGPALTLFKRYGRRKKSVRVKESEGRERQRGEEEEEGVKLRRVL